MPLRRSARHCRPARVFEPDQTLFGWVDEVAGIPGRPTDDSVCHSGTVRREAVLWQSTAEQYRFTDYYIAGGYETVEAYNPSVFRLKRGQRVKCTRQPNGLWVAYEHLGYSGAGREFFLTWPYLSLTASTLSLATGFQSIHFQAGMAGEASYYLDVAASGSLTCKPTFPAALPWEIRVEGILAPWLAAGNAAGAEIQLSGSGVDADHSWYVQAFGAATWAQSQASFSLSHRAVLNAGGGQEVDLRARKIGGGVSDLLLVLTLFPLADVS